MLALRESAADARTPHFLRCAPRTPPLRPPLSTEDLQYIPCTSPDSIAPVIMDANWPADSHAAGDVGDSPASTAAEAAIDDCAEHVEAVATGGYKAPSDAEVEAIGAPDAGKQKRRSWTDSYDVKLINAARAANAHVAPRGKISEWFENAATIFNSQPQAPFTVTGNVMQDRFNSKRKQ